MPKPKDKARFMKFVNKKGQIMGHLKKPCWEWTGTVDKDGRPRFRLDHVTHLARRAILLLDGEQLYAEQCVIAVCLNPLCVKPDHLAFGTEEEAQAMSMKGTQGRFYPGDLWLIRKVVADGEATVEYAAMARNISVELAEKIVAAE